VSKCILPESLTLFKILLPELPYGAVVRPFVFKWNFFNCWVDCRCITLYFGCDL